MKPTEHNERVKKIRKTREGLKGLIREKGLTQKQLAEKYGCSRGSISVALGICEEIQSYIAYKLGFSTWRDLCRAGLKKERKNESKN